MSDLFSVFHGDGHGAAVRLDHAGPPASLPVAIEAAEIAALLARYRYHTADEADLQRGIATVLEQHGLRHELEKDLGPFGRADVYLPRPRIAIELKVDGSPASVLRQLHRYALCDQVAALVLVTTRVRLAPRGLASPAQLCGKPFVVCLLWENAL